MREALSAMTTRGRSFVAAGGTVMLFAVLAGEDALLRVGALLILLPLLAAYFVGRSRYQLGLTRALEPAQVAAGQQALVRLDLTNDGRSPTALLLLEDHIPYTLGSRPRFVVNRMGSKWRRKVQYAVQSEVRGRFTIGPMTVRLSDPFGLVELHRAFSSTSSLVVTPRIVPLPAIPLSGAWTGSGDNRPRAFASGSAEDITVREYRRGDDLRRVHWRSSAHAGELMVRREEQPWQSRATLVLDNRMSSHRGSGASSSLEHAVSITASIAVHLVQRGFAVRLVTAAGEERGGSWHTHATMTAETAPLLESLAVLTEAHQRHLDMGWLQEAGHCGLLIAVVGAVDRHDLPALSRMRHSAASTMALALDVDQWGPRTPGWQAQPSAASLLRSRGWRAANAGPGDPVAAVWQELAQAHRNNGAKVARAASDAGRAS